MTHRIAIIGSGPSGMTAALLLARRGHAVTLVDRDLGPVAGRPWERVGVMQFHLPHTLRSPGRRFLAQRLPDVLDALVDAGGVVEAGPGMPTEAAVMHIRRAVLERTIWEAPRTSPASNGSWGTWTKCWSRAAAPVVSSSTAYRSLPTSWSTRAVGLGASPTSTDRSAKVGSCGMAYAARQFELLPGAQRGPTNGGPGAVTEHPGFAQLVFIHDSGTFTVLIARAARDRELAELRHEAAYDAALALLPAASAWTDPARSRPIDHVRAGAGLDNHYQGQPTRVRGLLAVGDAVCTTNPMGARGLSLGMLMGGALSDVVEGQPPAAVVDRAGGVVRDEHPPVVRRAPHRRLLAARRVVRCADRPGRTGPLARRRGRDP